MKLYFARHGETDVNTGLQQAGRPQIDEPLNSIGILQAEQLAEKLKDITFKAIISSPLQRALQTAKMINEFHKLGIQIDDAWRELSTSVYLDASSWHDAFDFDKNEAAEGVEPVHSFFERIYGAIDTLKTTYGRDDSILVVSHGGVHQAVYAYFNALALTGNMRISLMKNCEVRIYEMD